VGRHALAQELAGTVAAGDDVALRAALWASECFHGVTLFQLRARIQQMIQLEVDKLCRN
jgi:hypothetical protein